MVDNKLLDYEEELNEGFSEVNQELALKAIIFSMLFYIIDSDLINKIIETCMPIKLFGKEVIKATLFGILYYFISICIS